MTVRDLLTMSGGHGTGPKADSGDPSVRFFFLSRWSILRALIFLYNTVESYVPSAIVTKVTGQTVLDSLKPRLFEPLGIEKSRWDSSSEEKFAGWPWALSPDRGHSEVRAASPAEGQVEWQAADCAEWIEEATSKQISNENKDHTKIGPDWKRGMDSTFGDAATTLSAAMGRQDSSLWCCPTRMRSSRSPPMPATCKESWTRYGITY